MFKHFFILILLLSSCAHEKNGMSLGKRSLDEFYVGSGVIRYFQPSIPQWINYSQESKCHRKTIPYYLNYSNISSSFNLTYFEMMQLQYSFNNQYKKLLPKVSTIFNYASFLICPNQSVFNEYNKIFTQTNTILIIYLHKQNRIEFT